MAIRWSRHAPRHVALHGEQREAIVRRMRSIRLSLIMLTLTSACATNGNYTYTASMPKAAPPKSPGCDFLVVNLPPQGPYEEIGTVGAPEGERVDTPTEFKQAVRSSVCQAGGDVVVTQVNGAGYYVRGTVLRKTE